MDNFDSFRLALSIRFSTPLTAKGNAFGTALAALDVKDIASWKNQSCAMFGRESGSRESPVDEARKSNASITLTMDVFAPTPRAGDNIAARADPELSKNHSKRSRGFGPKLFIARCVTWYSGELDCQQSSLLDPV